MSILHQSQLGKQENVNQIKWNAEKCPIFVQTWSSSSMLVNRQPFKTLRMNSRRNNLLRTDTSKKLAKHFAVHAQIKSLKPLKDTFSTDEAADKP